MPKVYKLCLPSGEGTESFLHTTPASSLWKQLCISQPSCWQAAMVCSSPRHLTLSIKMGNEEFPGPKDSTRLAPEKFNILQTTVASLMPQWSSQTVPHLPWWCTSTRPSSGELEPLRRTFTTVKKHKTNYRIQDTAEKGNFETQIIFIWAIFILSGLLWEFVRQVQV